MRYADKDKTLIIVSKEEAADLGGGEGGTYPVAAFKARGGSTKGVAAFEAFGGDLVVAKAELNRAVDRHAEQLRLQIVGTDSNSQIEVYRNKYDRALAGDVAFLEDEAKGRGVTAEQLAALVLRKGDEWRIGGQLIEAAKAAHKTAIAAIKDVNAADRYETTLGWPA